MFYPELSTTGIDIHTRGPHIESVRPSVFIIFSGVRQKHQRKDKQLKIQDKSYVAINYILTLDSGEEIDKSEEGKPLGFIFNTGMMIPGLEKELDGREQGYSTNLVIEPEDGYGMPVEELFRTLPRENFPEDLDMKPGMVFQAQGPHGAMPFKVKEVGDDTVTIDLNHPLCGQRLHFDLDVAEVREATEEELAERAVASGCGEGTCSGCTSSH